MIQADYFFMGEGDQMLTCIAMVDKKTGMIGATAVQRKGIEHAAVRYCVAWLENLGYRQFVVHTDGEPAVVDFMRSVVAKFTEKMPETEQAKI